MTMDKHGHRRIADMASDPDMLQTATSCSADMQKLVEAAGESYIGTVIVVVERHPNGGQIFHGMIPGALTAGTLRAIGELLAAPDQGTRPAPRFDA